MRPLVIALSLFPAVADARFYSGNDIMKMCQGSKQSAMGFASGVFDTIKTAQELGFIDPAICNPSEVTLEQITDVMCSHIEKSPEDRDISASAMAWVAFQNAWPCPF